MNTNPDRVPSEEMDEFFNMENYLMCISDLNGHFLKVNSTFEKVLGYTAEELLRASVRATILL